jgi:hypothetical protein
VEGVGIRVAFVGGVFVGGGVVGLDVFCGVAGGLGVGGGLVDAFLRARRRRCVDVAAIIAFGSAGLGLGLCGGGQGLLCELPRDQLGAEGCGGYVGNIMDASHTAAVAGTAVVAVTIAFPFAVFAAASEALAVAVAFGVVGQAVGTSFVIVPASSFGFLIGHGVFFDLGFGLALAGARSAVLAVAVTIAVVATGCVASEWCAS